MKRSQLIAGAGALAVARAVPVRAQSLETVRFGVVPVEEAAAAFYAKEKGFFAKFGVDAQVTVLPNGGSVTQAILGGSLDCGVTNSGSISSAHARGVPLYLIACGATYTPSSPIAHLVVAKNGPIKNAKDLSGKTLAVSTLRDMIQGSVLAWIDKNGGDAKAVNFTELPPPNQAAAIVAKRIDGSALVEPFYTRGKADLTDLGSPYSAVNNDKPFQTLGIAASKSWVDAKLVAARKVADAIHAAAKWANDPKNHPECATILAQYTKVEPAVIAAYPRLTFAEANSPALVQPVIDMLAHYSYIPSGFSAADLFPSGMTG
jgi:NitT/TauT family transport system substrate-binding protein